MRIGMVDAKTQSGNLTRLLIADDHPAVREGLVAILIPRIGVQVVAEACNGAEAVDLFCQHRPDVAIMDLRMPRMDGLEATRSIRENFPDARIIILSAFSGEEENCLRAGAKAVVLKDAPIEQLLTAIRSQRDEVVTSNGTALLPVSVTAVDELRRSKVETICNAFATMNEAIIVANVKGKVLFVNSIAEQLTGWRLTEAFGQDIAAIYNTIGEEGGEAVHQFLPGTGRGDDLTATRMDVLLVSKEEEDLSCLFRIAPH